MTTRTLYRAADSDYLSDVASFAAEIESARAYLDDPGFGVSRRTTMRYHLYADDGYESTHRTLLAARRAARRGLTRIARIRILISLEECITADALIRHEEWALEAVVGALADLRSDACLEFLETLHKKRYARARSDNSLDGVVAHASAAVVEIDALVDSLRDAFRPLIEDIQRLRKLARADEPTTQETIQ